MKKRGYGYVDKKKLPVKAFMKVAKVLFNILKNGSLTGYFLLPHKEVCSRICVTPVLSFPAVWKAILFIY